MARITVEDCTPRIPNQFELTLTGAVRARQLSNGATPMVADSNNKPTVTALREIAAGQITTDILKRMR